MKKGKAALTACSDPISGKRISDINRVADLLREEGLDVVMPPEFFRTNEPSASQKAEGLMRCFRDPDIEHIFDVSGGDLANTVLTMLDFDEIRKSRATFYGFSDLTTIINAIIARTGRCAVNYQIRRILQDQSAEQIRYLREKILPDKISCTDMEYRFLRGKTMRGKIIGGNIRCFLKLAGTAYWPETDGNILLLESMGGAANQMMTALEQLRQLGVFTRINGILLGTFSKMEEENLKPTMEDLVMGFVPESIPIAKTHYIGHYSDARAVVLGKDIYL